MTEKIYLIVTPFFPSPESWRGAYCFDFVQALEEELAAKSGTEKWKVVVFVPEAGGDYDYQGVHVCRFANICLPSGIFPFLAEGVNRRRFLAKLLSTGICPRDVAVCHVHTCECAIYARALKKLNPQCRTFVHHHNCEPIRLNAGRCGNIPGYADLMYRWQRKNCEQVDLHVFCSEKSRTTYGRYFATCPEEPWRDIRGKCLFGRAYRKIALSNSVVLYNGFDEMQFYPKPIGHAGFVIGCVGNFQPLKGQLRLLEAVRMIGDAIPDLRVRFVGSGVTLSECRRFSFENGLDDRVSFETEIDHTLLPAFYNSIDLFVLPSRLEGFCCVYMEASACGVPFIGCQGISCAEVLPGDERMKWLANPDDATSLAEKIVNYYGARPKQQLTRSMKWRDLVSEFVEKAIVA